MQNNDSHSDNDLIVLLNEGDTAAFDKLFIEMYPALCLLANKIVEDEAAAKDIVSEVFLQLWKSRTLLQEVKSISAYLYVSTRNRSFNHLKKLQREERKAQEAQTIQANEKSYEDILQDVFKAETVRVLHEAILTLPTECAKVVQLNIEGFSTNEIAQQLGISASAVSHQKARAIRLLREKIAPGIALLCLLLAE
ncbi:RNA polymerase sigma-70 factor (ECF subfamily) [Chitinophaga skermanii]|uniref:RNA polymerase sigma-70 factor (ECF subfamily) n=1 Tax=Chitinophaga skermanii TaxID=331697 RepID=A0A327QXU1_9BACT|nr:RNA polymerase sigma-70 factor [Chitinophaga skermanii]RAJ08452.1 RNA polymerase sigma-70 factor (ECF subfamily) [Chitinophaga skermanii]